MDTSFHFTPRQRAEIVKVLGTDRAVPSLEQAVDVFRTECATQMTLAQMADHLLQIQKSSRVLQRSLKALAKGNRYSADWILEPLSTCEHYASALHEYRFAGRLKTGRSHHTAKIKLVQRVALYWVSIRGKAPGRGRGPFSRLVGKLLRYSEVKGAVVKYPDELVREALPQSVSVALCGPDYPFAPLLDQRNLPPMTLKAEQFFWHILWLAEGSHGFHALASKSTGKTDQ